MRKMLLILFFLVLGLNLHAANLPNFPFVVSLGEAKKTVKPDLATIHMKIISFDKDSARANSQANKAIAEILGILKKYHINIKSLEAGDIEKDTKRARDKNYNNLAILGYQISRSVTLSLDDISKYAKLMNALVSVNNITNFSTLFDSTNRLSIESALISEAGVNAKKRAIQMASSLGTKIHSVYAISQASNFADFFATFGASSTQSTDYLRLRQNYGKVVMFVPETITITESLNVVFRLKSNLSPL